MVSDDFEVGKLIALTVIAIMMAALFSFVKDFITKENPPLASVLIVMLGSVIGGALGENYFGTEGGIIGLISGFLISILLLTIF
jgi:hypothetical protein